MRLIVTGGGTGGHVYPALEIARAALDRGHEVMYFGSKRGQEKAACEKAGIVFRGFRSEPFLGVRSIKGLKSGWNLFWAGQRAKGVIKHADPDVVFSTGGYSSFPVMAAAKAHEIPYVILEQNSVPGRVNQKAGPDAVTVCTVFEETARHFRGSRVVRTGMPVRREIRDAKAAGSRVLVMGGSQGASALNNAACEAARTLGLATHWTHLTGRVHFEAVAALVAEEMSDINYEVRPFLEGDEMASALASASVAVCRSGAGTLTELAARRIPSVLVPYPAAHAGHQLQNAREFERLGAAAVIEQDVLTPDRLAGAIQSWLVDGDRRKKAEEALANWDMPQASETIIGLLEEAAVS